MKILWNKKLIKLSNGSYISWGLKKKKFFFTNKNELKLNATLIEYYEEREICNEKVISDYRKVVAELKELIEKMKCCGNCKKLRGRFDHNTNINILYCSDSDMKQIEVGFQMCCCKWEIKEDD